MQELWWQDILCHCHKVNLKANRKVQRVLQSQAAANPRHKEEEKKGNNQRVQNKHTNAREAHRPTLSSTSDVITMLKGLEKKTQKKKNTRTQSKEILNMKHP